MTKQVQAKSVNQYIRVLTSEQQADGSFLTSSVPAGGAFETGATTYQTTFATALILGALVKVPGQQLEPARQRAVEFLLAQRSPVWSFNYWSRTEPEAKVRPYPDDWDDTSCSLAALTLVRPEVVTGEVLGHIVRLLTQTEAAEGGPYWSWIISDQADKHWHDVDMAVNANIAFLLHLQGVDLPNLEHLADQGIAEGRLSSPYYPSVYPLWYFLSRWYQGAHRAKLLSEVLDQQSAGRWGNPLHTALAVMAALNLGSQPAAIEPAVRWLEGLPEAKVRAQAFCYDPAIAGRPYVAGSRALTAAFCLEALARYEVAMKAAVQPAIGAAPAREGEANRLSEQVVQAAMARFEQAEAPVRLAAQRVRDRLLTGTAAGQITLLPFLFRQALGKNGQAISDERVVDLGKLSLYGWMAYTIYDDFLDEEGDPTLLPVANVALRELVLTLQREAEARPAFGQVAWAYLDLQEAANAWEVSHCRVRRQTDLTTVAIPHFGDLHWLADRSLGHSLGGLAMALELGFALDNPQVAALQDFFRHFLIARQLSDDAHDWTADLKKGQINVVAARLLAGVNRRGLSVTALYKALEQYFWTDAMADINVRMLDEASQARAALKQAHFVQRPGVLEVLLAPIEQAAREAQRQQQETLQFLQTYQSAEPRKD